MSTSIPFSPTLTALLRDKNTRVVVFTGAGISVESGIPTFRGKDGLWKQFRAEELATMEAFRANPNLVWQWYQSRRAQMLQAQPNPGHLAIAELERRFSGFTLVTQNIDGLHDRAGNKKILKLHGDIWETRCLTCGTTGHDERVDYQELPPLCPCGGILRLGVVWFGEMLPPGVFEAAEEAATGSTLFFSIGTSAVVYPAAFLPQEARESGAYVVEINIEPSAAAVQANEFLQGKAGEILPELLRQTA